MGLFDSIGDIFGLGSASGAEEDLSNLAKAPFESFDIQKFLPPALRQSQTGAFLNAGIQGIGGLITDPGGLSPNVEDAIRQRLATQSESIAQDFRGIQSQAAGRGARTNAPVSIKNALASAIDIAQSRAQRGARREALTDTDQLRRQDLQQTFQILNTILQFISSGRGQGVAGLGAAGEIGQNRQAANLAFLSSALGSIPFASLASASRFKEGIIPVSENEILDAIRELPVYEWRYKGAPDKHIGPMAEDFLATFGLGSDPDSIQVVDAVGTLMAATQALARKVERLETVN